MQLLRIDWNVLFTIINLLILYFGLRKFLIKPVTNVMEQRRPPRKNLPRFAYGGADQFRIAAEQGSTERADHGVAAKRTEHLPFA